MSKHWAPELHQIVRRAVEQHRPNVNKHPRMWEAFLESGDEQVWEQHLRDIGQTQLGLQYAKEDIDLELMSCDNGTGRCGCDGCLEQQCRRDAELAYRDPDRNDRALPVDVVDAWLRAGSEYHARWLNIQGAKA